jgi:hypothetical protein
MAPSRRVAVPGLAVGELRSAMVCGAFCSLSARAAPPLACQARACSTSPREGRSKARHAPRQRRPHVQPAAPAPVAPEAAILASPALLTRLRRLLRARPFLSRVTALAACAFVRFTGIVFERQPVGDECPDGIPPEMRAYRENVRYVVVNVPPGVVARVLSQPTRATGPSAGAYAECLRSTAGQLVLAAVYERCGLDRDDIQDEQEAERGRAADIESQFDAWSDRNDARRLETASFTLDGADLFEESLDDLLGMS